MAHSSYYLSRFDFKYERARAELGIESGSHFHVLAQRRSLVLPCDALPFRNQDWNIALCLFSPFLHQSLAARGGAEQIQPGLFLECQNRSQLWEKMVPLYRSRVAGVGRYQAQKLFFAEIMLLDLYRAVSFQQLVQMISLLARLIVQDVLVEIWPAKSLPYPALIAMGKLGAEELNYSSDIDLLFLCSDEDNNDETVKWIRYLMRELSHIGPQGFLYRVDARLRPLGQSGGALARTVESYRSYYYEQGQTWERQALLKASFLAGDENLGNQFLDSISEFVFHHPATSSEIRDIRDIKMLIEKELAASGSHDRNIKLMSGGIRDIEFMIQMMQLYHGYANEGLRHPNHIIATRNLTAHNFISDDEARSLIKIYVLFRELEHRLQARNFSPVRLLPDAKEDWDYLASSFPVYHDGLNLQKDVIKYRGLIRDGFHRRINDTIRYLEKQKVVFDDLSNYETQRIAFFLQGFRDQYIEQFTSQDIAEHYRRLLQLSFPEPVDFVAAPGELPGFWSVQIVALDKPFVFSFLVGELSVAGLHLHEAASFSFRSPLHAGLQERYTDFVAPPMVSRFIVRGEKEALDRWLNTFRPLFLLLEQRGASVLSDYKLDLRRRFFERPQPNLVDIHSSIDYRVKTENLPGLDATILEIRGKDYPGFLFESITALQELGLKILECKVDTHAGIVLDRFLISHLNDTPITDEQLASLEKRLSLMKFFSRHLDRVADPAVAYQKFYELIGTLEDARKDHFVFTDDLMQKIGLLLGSGEFVRQRFFLSEGLRFLEQAQQHETYHHHKMRIHVDENMQFIQEARQYFHKIEDPQLLLSYWQTTLESSLNRWRESLLYDVCLEQVQGKVPYDILSDYFSDILEIYIKLFLQLQERLQLARRGIDKKSWDEFTRWAVMALGKFGGRELGYGSDLEIIFIYDAQPEYLQHNPDIWFEMMRALVKSLPAQANHLFHIDLRLRPHGNSGPLASSLGQMHDYYHKMGQAHPFERQALIKSRIIATREFHRHAKSVPGSSLLEQLGLLRRHFTFSGDFFSVSEIYKLRHEQIRNSEERHLKFGKGGLVEIEYSVQHLQMAASRISTEPLDEAIFATSTFQAIRGLRNMRILSAYEAAMLRHHYSILRILINALRFSIGRDDAYVMPDKGTPAWSRVWRLVREELVCAEESNLDRLIQSTLCQVSHWWESYRRRLPQDWLQESAATVKKN